MNGFLTFIERFKLSTKLMIGFSSGLIIAALIGFQSLQTLKAMEAEMESLYDLDLLGISHIKAANVNLILMGRSLRHALIAQDDITRDKARAQINTARNQLRSEMEDSRKRIFRAEVIAKYDEFQRLFVKYNENVEHALALLERERVNSSEAAKFITSAEFMATVNGADEALGAMTKFKETGSLQRMEELRKTVESTRLIALLMVGLGILLAVGFGVLIGRSIQRPNDRLSASVEGLAKGDVSLLIPHTDYPNEIGVMARAIAVLQDIYRQANSQHWVKSHAAEISTALQQAEDFRTLTQTAVSKIAPVIGAGHGAFYVLESDGRYNLLATYGYRERKHLNSSFATGEGLVGQCVMEKTSIMLTAPKDYIRINSGLGEGPPACVMVIPVIQGERVLGVLEMASFQQFSDREKAVLDALEPVLATSMEILDRNLKTRELLAATQEQAERMEKQAAQLEEQTVEMEAQQAELLETENWFRSIIETSPDGMLVTDSEGQILLTNPQLESIFGYEPGELIGGHIDSLVPARVRGGHGGLRETFIAEGKSRQMAASPRLTGVCKNGAEVAVSVTLSPLPPRGTRGKCVSVSVRKIEI